MGDFKSFYYVVGRSSCPWCVKAKELLEEKEIDCQFRDLESERNLLIEYTKKFDWNTVPMIFHVTGEKEYEFLGGYSELQERIEG